MDAARCEGKLDIFSFPELLGINQNWKKKKRKEIYPMLIPEIRSIFFKYSFVLNIVGAE
jgi:hypothetical protein